LAALVLPTTMLPRLNELTESVTCAVLDPLSATVCVPALSTMLSAPVKEPTVAGANVTEIAQEEPGATLVQVLV
jgi:hypothetical protein